MDREKLNVSIVVPVYNVSQYIERCIKSVMVQTYPVMECIIVDDASPDDSVAKCERLIDGYDGPVHFVILHHDHNRGLSAARNTGTDAAHGDYLFYLDSDDELFPNSLFLMIEAAQKYSGAELVQGYVTSIPHKSFYEMDFLSDIDFVEDNKMVRKNYYSQQNRLPVNAWNKLLKRSFIVENALYFQEGLLFEDELWMFHVVKHLSGYCVVHQPTYLHRWRRSGSIMSTKTTRMWVDHWNIILNEIVHHLDTPFYREQLLHYYVVLISIYGMDGLFPSNSLIKEYQNKVRTEHFYGIYIIFIIMEKTFPVFHGKMIKRILYHLIGKKLYVDG